MKQILILFFVAGFATSTSTSCTNEFVSRPQKPVDCKAAGIEKNIVGTWHFVSTFNPDNKVTTGTVTFTAQGAITDPDSLFDNYLRSGLVIAKTYKPVVASQFTFYTGSLFEVYQTTKSGGMQIIHLVSAANECNKIVLGLLGSQDYHTRVTLTR